MTLKHVRQLHAQKTRSTQMFSLCRKACCSLTQCSLCVPLQSVHSYCFLLLHTIFQLELSTSNPFMTAGSLTNSFASHSMCTSLPMINLLKRRLPGSLFWIVRLMSSLISFISPTGAFFPSLPFFRQIMLSGAESLALQAKALFYLRFL